MNGVIVFLYFIVDKIRNRDQLNNYWTRLITPYTQALLYSVPDFSRPLSFKSKLGTLEGTVPILEQMPIGCRLGPRCPFAQRECIQNQAATALNSMSSPAIIR